MSDPQEGSRICPDCRDGHLLDMGGFALCEVCGAEVVA